MDVIFLSHALSFKKNAQGASQSEKLFGRDKNVSVEHTGLNLWSLYRRFCGLSAVFCYRPPAGLLYVKHCYEVTGFDSARLVQASAV
uniref:Uncharacterized protein n=1 Tax=Anguilla anguilla TaxID=7936 RepID=A0A0E9X3H3_ANGAN